MLTPQQIAQAKQSPVDLGEVLSGGWYKRADHLELLNKALLKVASGEIKRLAVHMPPRYSKSQTCSHYLPVWWLGQHPEHEVILGSYGQALAEDWGRRTRDTMREHGEQVFGLKVREDSDSVARWQLENHRGGMRAVGIGGAMTGRGANLLIIDDPVKNSEEAFSAVIQKRNAEWWDGTAYTRLEPDAAVILMMTRWHTNDLAGYIRSKSTEQWTVIELPALAEHDDPLGRAVGVALWPDRFSQVAVEAQRDELCATDMGKYYWEAEYQQHPSIPEGLLYFSKSAAEMGKGASTEPRETVETRAIPSAAADGYVKVWERPLNGERYYIGADTADGKGEALGTFGNSGGPDRNAAYILRVRDDSVVAAIYGRQEEAHFAKVLYDWGRAYNDALLGVETNRRPVISHLRAMNYPNLYRTRPDDLKLLMPVNPTPGIEYGWNTNVRTRPVMLADLRELISAGASKCSDEAYWDEALTFAAGDPPAALPGNHDDRVMAMAVAVQVGKQARTQSTGNTVRMRPVGLR